MQSIGGNIDSNVNKNNDAYRDMVMRIVQEKMAFEKEFRSLQTGKETKEIFKTENLIWNVSEERLYNLLRINENIKNCLHNILELKHRAVLPSISSVSVQRPITPTTFPQMYPPQVNLGTGVMMQPPPQSAMVPSPHQLPLAQPPMTQAPPQLASHIPIMAQSALAPGLMTGLPPGPNVPIIASQNVDDSRVSRYKDTIIVEPKVKDPMKIPSVVSHRNRIESKIDCNFIHDDDILIEMEKKGKVGNKRRKKKDVKITQDENGEIKRCKHCLDDDTPEWRHGPYGERSVCNACGLFHRKLVHKFGYKYSNLLMRYRRRLNPLNRKVPNFIEIPVEFFNRLQNDTLLNTEFYSL
ncbi:hypothetical protein KAFR_0F02680 [Kazachstania africana CBS 2517]|uniref:GATA-type domain-containing protein n=1 Tax=Kazachstania africana (strain ATCC 22294 / BCRC 22015 / CBS 2517 / CECT 1963 / NBRC 1671 / NRRL Y-8276) TaxID=1071382 RepID=H2AWW5_KAZAF|nr:hypothetical protein KAFR_0F02680 [Kazachstania africana CBS 2517]CCF58865.1 hypothetical protein KAFR_0F02680 [Kazachstania africana CBS 2517]